MEPQGPHLVLLVGDGDEARVPRVAVDGFGERRAVRVRRHAARERTQQGAGEGQQAGDGGERVAGEADEVTVRHEVGEDHGVAGAYRDAVDEGLGEDAAQRRMHVVDRPVGGAPGRDDHVGAGGHDGLVQRLGVVLETAGGDDLRAEGAQPGGEHRAERVADAAVAGQPLVQQLVAQYEHLDAGPRYDAQRVVTGRRRQPQHGRRHERTRRKELVAAAALLAARADVLTGRHRPGRVEPGRLARRARLRDGAVLAAQDGGRAGRYAGAGGDTDRPAVGERFGTGVTGEDAGAVGVEPPGAGAGDGPAVHGGGVEGGQVGEGGEGFGEYVAERAGEVLHHRFQDAHRPRRTGTGVGPGEIGGRGGGVRDGSARAVAPVVGAGMRSTGVGAVLCVGPLRPTGLTGTAIDARASGVTTFEATAVEADATYIGAPRVGTPHVGAIGAGAIGADVVAGLTGLTGRLLSAFRALSRRPPTSPVVGQQRQRLLRGPVQCGVRLPVVHSGSSAQRVASADALRVASASASAPPPC